MLTAATLWLVVFGVIDYAVPGVIAMGLFSLAPLIVAAVLDERRTAPFAVAAVGLAIGSGVWHGAEGELNFWIRAIAVGAVSGMAVGVAGVRRRREERLAEMTAIAEATQLALLPPLPARMAGLGIAARYRSATENASVGGDLYEIIPSPRGTRAIIGDVRGKGLEAVRLAGQVLSAFRRSAVTPMTLEQVSAELRRTIRPLLGEEEFVTAALVEIGRAGRLRIVNCGHHPLLLRSCEGMRPLTGPAAALPLGLGIDEDEVSAYSAAWSPGDRLLLYTDGLVESRDSEGRFLPSEEIATALDAPDCEQAVDALVDAVYRHAGGLAHDDMALLLLENQPVAGGAGGVSPATGHR